MKKKTKKTTFTSALEALDFSVSDLRASIGKAVSKLIGKVKKAVKKAVAWYENQEQFRLAWLLCPLRITSDNFTTMAERQAYVFGLRVFYLKYDLPSVEKKEQ